MDVGQADMGFPFPGVLVFGLREGTDLKSVLHEGARGTSPLAFRAGEDVQDVKEIEGETTLPGSAAWHPIVDPMPLAQGVDVATITYVEAGGPTWGTALARGGQGDATLSWEGPRAERIAWGLEFEQWLGVQTSPLPATNFVVRASDVEDQVKRDRTVRYLRGWAMWHEFAHHNPRAAVQAVFEQFPTLASNLGLMSLVPRHNVVRGDRERRQGWRWHRMASWPPMFDMIAQVDGSAPVVAEEVVTNDLIPQATTFDAARLQVQAAEEFTAVDIDVLRATMFDQAI